MTTADRDSTGDSRRPSSSGTSALAAVVMHRYDVPRPAVQLRILDERGRFVARPDFVWLEEGVVGEADGLGKYDGDAGAVVAEERGRQARLQALGLVVIRWTEQQLYGDPPLLVQQLRAALAAGRPGSFRGRVA
jgi:very-short-patch-repair endonuclease